MDAYIQDLPMSSLRDLSEQRILTPEPHLNRYMYYCILIEKPRGLCPNQKFSYGG